MHYENRIRGAGKRLFALFLALVTIFSLCTTALAEDSTETPVDNSAYGYLSLRVYPRIGSSTASVNTGSTDGSYSASFISNVMLNKDDSIKASESVFGFVAVAEYYVDGVVDHTQDVKIWATTTKGQGYTFTQQKSKAKGEGSQQVDFSIDQTKDSVWYFYAECNGSRQELNATVMRLHTKTTNISYHRIGMQARAINETPFGQYDYLTPQGGSWMKNTSGMYLSGTTDHYNSTLESAATEYPKCYFDVKFQTSDDSSTAAAVAGITNLDGAGGLYAWLSTYTKAMEDAGKQIGDTVTLTGPAYVQCENGPLGEQNYNLAYYNPTDTKGVNTYAGWGDRTKDDFVALRFVTLIVPTVLIGTITVNCYNEDTNKLIGTKLIQSNEYRRTPSIDVYNENIMTLGQSFHEAYTKQFGEITKYNVDQYVMDYAKFKELASSLAYDTEQKKIVKKTGVEENITNIQKVIAIRDSMLSELDKPDYVWMKSYMGLTTVNLPTVAEIPGLKNFQFDFGLGNDAFSSKELGQPLMTADDTKTVIVTDQNTPNATLNLYYKAAGTTYTVQVSNNGTIIPDLTHTYPSTAGAVIKESDVDKSIVPADYTIIKVDKVPLTVVQDPTKNIITIVCGDYLPYKVMYYCDGVLKDTVEYKGTSGQVISSVPIKTYSGYTHTSTDTVPMTLYEADQIVRVYYTSKDTYTPAPASNLTLYKDKYVTKATTMYSGYGVYAYFVVDASDYFDKTSTWYYRATSSCGTRAASQTEPKYRNVKVTAVASWNDGLKKKTEKVNLVLDHVTSGHKYYFRLPNNPASNLKEAKAYIPVSWKDKTNWTVSAVGTISYEEIYWWNTIGHDSDWHPGKPGHLHTWSYDIPHFAYAPKTKVISDSSYVRVNHNMYEDDFTGSKS